MSTGKERKQAMTLLQATGRALEEVARTIANAPDPIETLDRLLDWIKAERARFPKRPSGKQ